MSFWQNILVGVWDECEGWEGARRHPLREADWGGCCLRRRERAAEGAAAVTRMDFRQ